MLKTILVFIKAHTVATAITVTAVVGVTIVTPIVASNYILDKNVRENLSMLVPSNFQSATNNQVQDEPKSNVNTKEPLTFRIEKVEIKQEGGGIVKDMQGNDAYEMSGEGVEYKIVPSYDKDYSEWTKAEKQAYQKAYEDAAKMAKAEYEANAANEAQEMQRIALELQQEMASWSEDYVCGVGTISYNSYTKKYRGQYTSKVIVTSQGAGAYSYDYKQETIDNISAEEFRNTIYPIMVQKYAEYKKLGIDWLPNETATYKANLEKVYHLSD